MFPRTDIFVISIFLNHYNLSQKFKMYLFFKDGLRAYGEKREKEIIAGYYLTVWDKIAFQRLV